MDNLNISYFEDNLRGYRIKKNYLINKSFYLFYFIHLIYFIIIIIVNRCNIMRVEVNASFNIVKFG